ncbi:MAG: ABC transporter substrate-binding protein [Burkholderiales bacterium]
MITRRKFLCALSGSALLAPTATFPVRRMPFRIAFISLDPTPASPTFQAFMAGLRELGWVEGKNVEVQFLSSFGKTDFHSALAAPAVRNKVSLIVTSGSQLTAAAKAATNTIPIVFGSAADPVAQGFVKSLASPGGNVTGLALAVQELGGKRFQLLKEMLPASTRLARMYQSGSIAPLQQGIIDTDDSAARVLGVKLQQIAVATVDDLEPAFVTAAREKVQGMHVTAGPLLVANRSLIAKLALKYRIPILGPDARFARAGALASYGEDFAARYRRVALVVDRILRGAKPADIPVEQPSFFEFVVNLRTAQALGVALPQSVLLQADRVID